MIAALLAAATLLLAAPAASESARAQAHIDRGTAHFKKKRFGAALSEFEQALPLVADRAALAVLRHNVARCLEELDRPEEAVAALDRYLELPDDPAAQARARRKREDLLARRFGRLTAHLDPPEARCTLVRERPPPTTATPGDCPAAPIPLLAGRYVLSLSADAPPRRASETVEVTPGAETTVELALPAWLRVEAAPEAVIRVGASELGRGEAAEGPVPPGAHEVTVEGADGEAWRARVELAPGEVRRLVAGLEAPAAPAGASRSAIPWPWLAAGGAAAALVGGAIFYGRGAGELDEADRDYEALSRAQSQADYDRLAASVRRHDDAARTDRTLSLALGGAGLALGGLATWLFLREEGP